MTYDCPACGEDFETLSRKRLHDCPAGAQWGGDVPDEELDTSDMSVDEMTEVAVEGVLQCDVCGEQNSGAEDYDREVSEKGVALSVFFECEHCGASNENTATLAP